MWLPFDGVQVGLQFCPFGPDIWQDYLVVPIRISAICRVVCFEDLDLVEVRIPVDVVYSLLALRPKAFA